MAVVDSLQGNTGCLIPSASLPLRPVPFRDLGPRLMAAAKPRQQVIQVLVRVRPIGAHRVPPGDQFLRPVPPTAHLLANTQIRCRIAHRQVIVQPDHKAPSLLDVGHDYASLASSRPATEAV